ncbi:MAG: flagellar hook-basal body protein [Vulcanimicrobiota bacterium]
MRIFDTLGSYMRNVSTATDILSNNLSNVETSGFKKVLTAVKEQQGQQGGTELLSFLDSTPGIVVQTSNPLDLAIDGGAFFVIQTDSGTRYTRNGNFSINDKGELLSHGKYKVMGKDGNPIILKGDQNVTDQDGNPIKVIVKNIIVSEDGTVTGDGNNCGTLKLVTIDSRNAAPAPEGQSMIICPENATKLDEKSTVNQNFLEQSNVSSLEELVSLTEKYRFFQTAGKLLQVQDDIYGKVTLLNSR